MATPVYIGSQMVDHAAIRIEEGASIALERWDGVNTNMTQSHYHTHFELYFLEDGGRYHILQDDEYETKVGDFMLFAPYELHRSYGALNVPFRRTVLYFTEGAIHSEALLCALRSASGLYHPTGDTGRTIRRMLGGLMEEQSNPSAYHEEMMETRLAGLLITILRSVSVSEPSQNKTRMAEVTAYIMNNYRHELRLADIAAHFYMNEYYLCHEFKRYTNRTIVQYTNTLRILHAQRMIMETDKSFTEIMRFTGFSSLTHFNRIFKAQVGMTPTAYRKLTRSNKT